jgi:hypothetical protein
VTLTILLILVGRTRYRLAKPNPTVILDLIEYLFIATMGQYADDEFTYQEESSATYKIVACCIFAIVSFTFLFPCNTVIPLDRRTVAVLGATLCYITRTFVFADKKMDMLHAVDFDVLVLLASIMAINHIVVHL